MSTPNRPRLALGCLVAALFSLPVLLIVGSHVAVGRVQAKFVAPKLKTGGGEALLADLEHFAKLGFFAGRGVEHDAAPVLNHLVAADTPVEGTTPAWWAEPHAFEALDLYKKDEQWLDHPEITARYDLAFLAEWQQFDHWTWDGSDPFAAHFASHPEQCPAASPLPNFVAFQWLAKVRLAQGYHAGDMGPAMAEVEHVAMLVSTTDTLVSNMVAVAILGIEDAAVRRALSDGKVTAVPPRGWTEDDRKRLKPALWAEAEVFRSCANPALADALAHRAQEFPGVCGALFEAATVGAMTRDMEEGVWPGEVDFSGHSAAITSALAVSGCALPSAKARWADPRQRGVCAELEVGSGTSEALTFSSHLPYLRSVFVAWTRSLGPTPAELGQYYDLPPG